MTDDTLDGLSTLTLTVRERVVVARAIAIAAAMVDALGDSTDELMDLWLRVSPEGVEA